MNIDQIIKHVDHTVLYAYAQKADIDKICTEASQYGMASVCIPSAYVSYAHGNYPELTICTVVGFPLGNCNTAAKLAETRQAIADGATEIDMVINVGALKDGNLDLVWDEIKALKEVCGDLTLKVIIETCYLTEEEKIAACKAVSEAGADFIKTSTGFGSAGATLGDVKLMRAHVAANVKVKAAGGIRSFEDAKAYLDAGADRIGASKLKPQS